MDSLMTLFDADYVLPSLECKDTVAFPAPTNHTKLSPDKKYLAVVGQSQCNQMMVMSILVMVLVMVLFAGDRGYFGYIPLNDNNTLGTPVAIQGK